MKNWLKINKWTIKGFANLVGCCHVVITKVCANMPISSTIASKITHLTNGKIVPKISERGRKKGAIVKNPKTKHNMCKRREYQIWSRMRRCCYHENFCQYKSYGALGITVCSEWDDFRVFVKDMGPLPKGYKSLFLDGGHIEFNKRTCIWVKDARGINRKLLKQPLFKKKAQSPSEMMGRDGKPLQMSFDENMVVT